MNRRPAVAYAVFIAMLLVGRQGSHAAVATDNEYAKHFGALSKLSVAVAEAMPMDEYPFRPDPGSMTFGELMSHIAMTNYAFCAGLKDVGGTADAVTKR